MAHWVNNPPVMQETQESWVRTLGQEDPLEEEMATQSSILPENSHGQRSLVDYSPKGGREADRTEELNTGNVGAREQHPSPWPTRLTPRFISPGGPPLPQAVLLPPSPAALLPRCCLSAHLCSHRGCH